MSLTAVLVFLAVFVLTSRSQQQSAIVNLGQNGEPQTSELWPLRIEFEYQQAKGKAVRFAFSGSGMGDWYWQPLNAPLGLNGCQAMVAGGYFVESVPGTKCEKFHVRTEVSGGPIYPDGWLMPPRPQDRVQVRDRMPPGLSRQEVRENVARRLSIDPDTLEVQAMNWIRPPAQGGHGGQGEEHRVLVSHPDLPFLLARFEYSDNVRTMAVEPVAVEWRRVYQPPAGVVEAVQQGLRIEDYFDFTEETRDKTEDEPSAEPAANG